MDNIIIATLQFPNDPTKNQTAHQMFVAKKNKKYIDLYSISSIIGKEKRVYGKEKDNYITITGDECTNNGFKVPSFIDCAKVYRVLIEDDVDITKLTSRKISNELKEKILDKISHVKDIQYIISKDDFCKWNPKIK